MRLSHEDENHLERWLIHELHKIHQSSPETLSRYIISLLKQDKDNLRASTQEELSPLLKEQTGRFIVSLFATLNDESFKNAHVEDDDEYQANDPESRGRGRATGGHEEEDSFDRDDRQPRLRRRDSEANDTAPSRQSHSKDLRTERTENINRGTDKHADRDSSRRRSDPTASRDYRRDINHSSRNDVESSRSDKDRDGDKDRGRDRDRDRDREKERTRDRDSERDGGRRDNNRNRDNRSTNDFDRSNDNRPRSANQQPPFPGGYDRPGSSYSRPGSSHHRRDADMDMRGGNAMMGGGFPPMQGGPNWGPPSYPMMQGSPFGPVHGHFFNPNINEGHPPHDMLGGGRPESMGKEGGERSSTEHINKDGEALQRGASYEDDLMIPNNLMNDPSPQQGMGMPGPFEFMPAQHGYPMFDPTFMPPPYGYPGADFYGGGAAGLYGYGGPMMGGAGMMGNHHHHQSQNNNRRGGNHGNRLHNHNQSANLLPESERCTLRCTGIPSYVKEEDLKAHFESFGHVVELQVTDMNEKTNATNTPAAIENESAAAGKDEKKKVYNECLVQFYSAPNAKKCLNSPVPVLSNRFIHLHQSHFNIIPPSDVPEPSPDAIEEDRALLGQDIVPRTAGSLPGKKRTQAGLNIFQGATNKWRRTETNAQAPSSDTAAAGDGASVGGDGSVGGGEGAEQPTTAVAAGKDKSELKKSLEELKSLKTDAEKLLKTREDVIQTQIDKCRQMTEKLENSPDSEKKPQMLQNLESRIVDLQSQLRAVRDQIAAGVLADKQSPPGKAMNVPYAAPAPFRGGGGYRGGRGGRGYGYIPPARGGYADRGFNKAYVAGGRNPFATDATQGASSPNGDGGEEANEAEN